MSELMKESLLRGLIIQKIMEGLEGDPFKIESKPWRHKDDTLEKILMNITWDMEDYDDPISSGGFELSDRRKVFRKNTAMKNRFFTYSAELESALHDISNESLMECYDLYT